MVRWALELLVLEFVTLLEYWLVHVCARATKFKTFKKLLSTMNALTALNVLEQARELLRRERAEKPVVQRKGKVTLVMSDKIFDADPDADLDDQNVGSLQAASLQAASLQAASLQASSSEQRLKKHQAFMDDVRRLGLLAQIEYERQIKDLKDSQPGEQLEPDCGPQPSHEL